MICVHIVYTCPVGIAHLRQCLIDTCQNIQLHVFQILWWQLLRGKNRKENTENLLADIPSLNSTSLSFFLFDASSICKNWCIIDKFNSPNKRCALQKSDASTDKCQKYLHLINFQLKLCQLTDLETTLLKPQIANHRRNPQQQKQKWPYIVLDYADKGRVHKKN